MLKNDERFWKPAVQTDGVSLSWSDSNGDYARLWKHSWDRWQSITLNLSEINLLPPAGKIMEFGAGMGLLDDLIQDKNSTILMFDHTDAFIRKRPQPLSQRCRHVLWTPENLELLSSEHGTFDWLLFIAVFFHVDDISASALILELGKFLKPGGQVLVQGWNPSTPEGVRRRANAGWLFREYPDYLLNIELIKKVVEPEYREIRNRWDMLLYQKI